MRFERIFPAVDPQVQGVLALFLLLSGVACSASDDDGGPASGPATSLAAHSDTVHVAAPVGDSAADRASIQAAFDAVRPGGTVQFEAGTYLIGGGARLTVPDVAVLGHPSGTVLRGCGPEAFTAEAYETGSVVFGRTGFYVQAERQTIRGLAFEFTWHGIVVGPYPTSLAEAESEGEDSSPPPSYPAGGHRIEGNTFRASPNGMRVLGDGDEVSVVSDNDFIDVFHAIGIYGAPLHFVDNRVTVVEPGRVPNSKHSGSAILVSPGQSGECARHVVAGNRVEGYPDAIYVAVFRGGVCRGVEIRDNTIRAARVRVPEAWGGYMPTAEDSTMVGIPITLMNRTVPLPGMPEADTEGVLENIVVEGNHILGAEGLGIVVQGVSRSRIAGNTISGIQQRSPFPGLTWDGFEQRWEIANGSGIWISEGSDENEVVGNTFEDLAASAVVIEGDRNIVELANSADSVRDLGVGNQVRRTFRAPDESDKGLPGPPHPASTEKWTDPSPHEIRFVTVAPGVQLEVLDWGGEGTPLVFLAGLRLNAHTFDDLAPRFTDTHRVVGITRRRHRESSWPDDGYAFARLVDDLRIVLDTLDLERVVFAGHSLAGTEITRFAGEHPDRVAGLVHIDAAHDLTLLGRHGLMAVCPMGPETMEAIE